MSRSKGHLPAAGGPGGSHSVQRARELHTDPARLVSFMSICPHPRSVPPAVSILTSPSGHRAPPVCSN